MMKFHAVRRALLIGSSLLQAAAPPQGTAPAGTNPFEAVPEPAQALPRNSGPAIEAIEFRGARRIPHVILRALVASRVGGAYDVDSLRRDTQALHATGRFSDIVWEAEPGRAGAIVRFVVSERPVVESIEFIGDESITIARILERLAQRDVDLRVETLFREDKLNRATAAVRELVVDRAGRDVSITPSVEPVGPPLTWPPSAVKIVFRAGQR
ncbi:MAG: POTRA domain-containing protein [Bryobacteraceae bacterium]